MRVQMVDCSQQPGISLIIAATMQGTKLRELTSTTAAQWSLQPALQ